MIAEIGDAPPRLRKVEVRAREVVRAIQAHLDAGEAEAIALALEHPGSTLLLDERRGRSYAAELGIMVIGTLGLLIEAKRRGLVSEVRPLVDALIGARFHVSEALYRQVLVLANEPL